MENIEEEQHPLKSAMEQPKEISWAYIASLTPETWKKLTRDSVLDIRDFIARNPRRMGTMNNWQR